MMHESNPEQHVEVFLKQTIDIAENLQLTTTSCRSTARTTLTRNIVLVAIGWLVAALFRLLGNTLVKTYVRST
jgi:hypothetical protein